MHIYIEGENERVVGEILVEEANRQESSRKAVEALVTSSVGDISAPSPE